MCVLVLKIQTESSMKLPPIESDIVQKNRNFLKEYWILRNILLPFNRIRIWVSNILLPLKGSRIRVVKILLQQNFNRIFRFWHPWIELEA